jgi:biotin carboxyl carrier protein
MRLEIKIHSGSKTSDHKLELATPTSAVTGATPPGGKGPRSAQRESSKTEVGHAIQGKLQPLLQNDPKPGAIHKAAPQVKAGAQAQSERLLRFSSDGESLIVDGEEISPGVYSILIEGRSYEAHVSKKPGDAEGYLSLYAVTVGLRHYMVEIRDPRLWRHDGTGIQEIGPQEIVAPMPGKIVKVLISENQEVVRGQGLLVIEAMKMQNEIRAPRAGRVERIYAQEETGVEAGFRLLRLV